MSWRCAWCGKPHEGNDPPCDSCGYNSFERVSEPSDSQGTVETGPNYVWECQNCGRTHVRNSPPCARCGSHSLEKVEQSYEDTEGELVAPSWLEVAKPYAPIIIGLLLVVGLFATGIVPLSVLPGVGTDVPGESSQAAGIDLEETALLVHDRLEDDREGPEASGKVVVYDDELEALATAENQRFVRASYTNEDVEESVDPSAYDIPCEQPRGVHFALDLSIDNYADEPALARAVVDRLVDLEFENEVDGDSEGIDIHVGPDGTVIVLYMMC